MANVGDGNQTAEQRCLELLTKGEGAIVWQADASAAHFSFVSDSAAAVLGVPKQQWSSEPSFLKNHVHPDDWGRLLDAIYRAASGGHPEKCEHRMLRADGSTVWAQTTLTPSEGPDHTTLINGITLDVTEVRRSDELARRDESRCRLIVDNLRGCGVFLMSPDGDFDAWSADAERITGHAQRDIVGKQLSLLFTERQTAIADRLLRAAERQQHAEYEGWLLRMDGTQFWGSLRLGAARSDARPPDFFSGAIIDLTERHAADAELRRRTEHLQLLVQSIQEHGVWMTSATGLVESWNPGAQRLSGYRSHEIIGSSVAKLLPETELAKGTLERLLEQSARTGCADYEGWLVRKSGEMFWGRIFFSAAEDAESDQLRGFGTVARDLTERKNTEDTLRANEEHFRLLVDSVQDFAIFMLTIDGHVASWNRGAQRLNGYRAHEILGSPAARFFPPDEVAIGTPEKLVERATSDGHATYEGWLIRRSGQRFWGMIDLDAIEDTEGRLRGFSNVARDLTAQRRVEAALRDSEERLRLLIDSVQDYAVFMVSPQRTITSWNAGAERLKGYRSDEIIGAPVSRCFPPEEVALGALDRLFDRATSEGRSEYEGWVLRKNGTRFWGNVMFSAVRDADGRLRGFSDITRDLTERMRIERAATFLAEAGQALAGSLDYRTTLEKVARLATRQLADCCLVAIETGTEIRPVAVAHQDAERQRSLETQIVQLTENTPLLRQIAGVMQTGESDLQPDVAEAEWLQADVRPEGLWIIQDLGVRSCMCVPMIVRGHAFGAITFLSSAPGRRYDARDLRLAEELARRAALAVENARLYEQAQFAIRLREEVLAVVSHDLRGPLGTILLSVRQLLEQGKELDATTTATLTRIARSAQRMTHMISDLLDFSSIQASRLTLEPRECNARDLVRDALETYEPIAVEKGVHIDDQTTSLDVRVRCDPNRIVQVFSNLLGNAVKFTPSGGTVRIGARVSADNRTLTFDVTDTGPGIADEDIPHIFDRYWQAKKRAREGVGLGLAIAKGLVEAHGGTLQVTSRIGVGSTFSFTLPVVS
ncbi:MAG: Sensory box histidine kinase [Labilithrix sp.]|nr:Sensory box histidine kinase [Labilithrix sp.]